MSSSAHRQSQRYAVSSPLLFRQNEGPWYEGTTVNIGARGLLFRASVAMPVASELDLRIGRSQGAAGDAHVSCSGRVVRTEPAPEAGETSIAMTIDQCQLHRAGSHQRPRSELTPVDW